MVTRVPVSAGTRVPGFGSASTAPRPVGYPVPKFPGRGATLLKCLKACLEKDGQDRVENRVQARLFPKKYT